MYHRNLGPPPGLGELPAVLLDTQSTTSAFASVVPDEFDAAYRATRDLIEHSHRRIAHISTRHPSIAS